MTEAEMMAEQKTSFTPGWDVCLVESLQRNPPFQKNGRQPLKIGLSPFEYREKLQQSEYRDERGFTVEDFLISFLCHLHETNEISYVIQNHSAIHCLAAYDTQSERTFTCYWHALTASLRLYSTRSFDKDDDTYARTVVQLK